MVSGLVKRYGERAAVAGLELCAPLAAVTAVLGPNGAGKTTSVEICEGLRTADAGTVEVLGRPPGSRELRTRVGVMPQHGGAYPGARARELLRLVASYVRDPLDPDELLERLGLSAGATTTWRRLSGGQQQRLSLAMAIVGRPELVFLDEPTAGLDPQARHVTWELVAELRAGGTAVVLTTHAIDEAEAVADHVVIIDAGRAVAAGSPGELTSAGATGQLRFRAARDLDLAGLVRALPPGSTAQAEEPGRYVVHAVVDPALVAAVTAWCAAADTLPQDIQVGRRSLEDVFLELTGRGLRE
jgi:ABC-2 type transport system ATP-binding protein